jgi:hypothetical protein
MEADLINYPRLYKSLIGELREALENREANFAIAVTDTLISEAVGCYREVEGDKIICAFGDNGLPLEVAYRIVRTCLLTDNREGPERVIDLQRICGIKEKIINDLSAIRGIKAKLTSIGNTADAISEDITALEQNIKESLNGLSNALQSETHEQRK